jgi:hypothetical protein
MKYSYAVNFNIEIELHEIEAAYQNAVAADECRVGEMEPIDWLRAKIDDYVRLSVRNVVAAYEDKGSCGAGLRTERWTEPEISDALITDCEGRPCKQVGGKLYRRLQANKAVPNGAACAYCVASYPSALCRDLGSGVSCVLGGDKYWMEVEL